MCLHHGTTVVSHVLARDVMDSLSAQDLERRKAHDAKELRDLSRQMYLTKREQQKLDELRDKIEDEERLFAVRSPGAWGHLCAHVMMASQQLPGR